LQSSVCSSDFVERVVNLFPHEQVTVAVAYSG
jgi:hypothetical protein